jgi:hypothetical protein
MAYRYRRRNPVSDGRLWAAAADPMVMAQALSLGLPRRRVRLAAAAVVDLWAPHWGRAAEAAALVRAAAWREAPLGGRPWTRLPGAGPLFEALQPARDGGGAFRRAVYRFFNPRHMATHRPPLPGRRWVAVGGRHPHEDFPCTRLTLWELIGAGAAAAFQAAGGRAAGHAARAAYRDGVCRVLRCAFRAPAFPPLPPPRPEWRTDTALTLARRAADAGDCSALPVLADALEDAGCDQDAVLGHLAAPESRCPACWAADWLLHPADHAPAGRAGGPGGVAEEAAGG